MLKAELEAAEDIPEHPLHTYSEDALVSKELLREQLDRYYHADRRPLPQYHMLEQSPIQYWRSQKQFDHMFVLAVSLDVDTLIFSYSDFFTAFG